MSRITPVNPANVASAVKSTLDGVQKSIGMVPNLFKVFALDPAVLQAYLQFSAALKGSSLGQKLGEQVALTVAGLNGCDYCASAHTAIGKGAGLSDADIAKALRGQAAGGKEQAALAFTRAVVEKRGQVTDADVRTGQAGGLSEGELVAIVAHVALNVFTNYVNHLAETDIDFPVVRAKVA